MLKVFNNKLSSDKSLEEKNRRDCENEVRELRNDFNKNKSSVIDFLITNTLNVDFYVPDVVKGNFAKKFK
jgi:hypothetical protein